MRCTQIKEWISDYIDGELDSSRSKVLEQHLEKCRQCREWLNDFRAIKKTAADLEEPVPSTGWEHIRARLDSKTPARSGSFTPVRFFPIFKPALAAAAVLMVAAAAVISWNLFHSPAGVSWISGQESALAKLKEAEHHYQMAIQSLKEAAEAQEGGLDPDIKMVFETNLEIINRSISSCKRAVLNDPEDFDSRDFLLAAYQEKMDLLFRMITYQDRSSGKTAKTTI
ncbi:MAG: zf-HC2 domain-containing protein [Candidatus Aminicenantes bacterium]